ncbi:MAG: PqqD family protein [Planctomycetota bacterium]
MEPSDTPKARDDVLFRELDDGCALYDPNSETVHSLNLTAGFIWCLMDGSRSLSEIASEISSAAEAGADPETVLSDVRRTAHELARQGLLE